MKTEMKLGALDVIVHHQGGNLLCVEEAGDKLRLSKEERLQVEELIGNMLDSDELLIDIMRIVCLLQNMGKVVKMDLRHRIQFNASNVDVSVFDDYRQFEAYLYDDVQPPFNSFITWSDGDLLPLRTLRLELQKLAVLK